MLTNTSQRMRKRSVQPFVPDSLYSSCMRIVTRNLAAFDPQVLCLLPALIKTQMLRNVTRHADAFGTRMLSSSSASSPTTGCGDGDGDCGLSVRLLQALLHRELLQLDLSVCGGQLTGEHLRTIVTAAPNLLELKLSGAIRLGTDDLLESLSRLPHLRSLHVAGTPAMADEVVQMLAARCPGLEHLDVSRCERVGDGSASTVRGMRLKKLNVAHTAITDAFLRQMIDSRFNEHLDEINLGGCAVTSDGLKHLRWDKLKYIGFEGANLTDMEFVKKLGNLKFIQWTIST